MGVQHELDDQKDLARRIKSNILPNIFPAYPECKKSDTYAFMTSAKEVIEIFTIFFD